MQEWYMRTPLITKKLASLQPAEKRTGRLKKTDATKEKDESNKKKKKKDAKKKRQRS